MSAQPSPAAPPSLTELVDTRGIHFPCTQDSSKAQLFRLLLCKPKIQPIKSFSLERLDELERKMRAEANQRREAEKEKQRQYNTWGSASVAMQQQHHTIATPQPSSPLLSEPQPSAVADDGAEREEEASPLQPSATDNSTDRSPSVECYMSAAGVIGGMHHLDDPPIPPLPPTPPSIDMDRREEVDIVEEDDHHSIDDVTTEDDTIPTVLGGGAEDDGSTSHDEGGEL